MSLAPSAAGTDPGWTAVETAGFLRPRGDGHPAAAAATWLPGIAPGPDGTGPSSLAPTVDASRWAQAVARWIEGLEWHRTGDRHVLRLHLTPAHLGPLHVEVAGDAGGLAARITVFNSDALALVNRHADELRQALAARGYPLASLDVGLGAAGGEAGRSGAGETGAQGGWRQDGSPFVGRVESVAGAGARRPALREAGWGATGSGRLDVRI
ncbi:MAG TPA: flagellar hook-length control protein FliK [Thermaerobacter sp.]